MAKMHDLDWLFAIGVLFFLLSAWGIGANVCLPSSDSVMNGTDWHRMLPTLMPRPLVPSL